MKVDLDPGCVSYSVVVFFFFLMFRLLGVNIMRVSVIVCRAVHVRRTRNPKESYIGSTLG
jgi:hypothetical protein